MPELDEDQLQDLLPLYYKRLFPHKIFNKWLTYGNNVCYKRREFSFTLLGDIYMRFLSFESPEVFVQKLHQRIPIKIDIGAIYNAPPTERRRLTVFTPVEKELVFDIDLTDYDDVRRCCSGAGVCTKCWKFMVIASKIIDRALREDFGFKNILWVFSGRRGIHCWVCDPEARKLSGAGRSAIAEYLQLIRGGVSQLKKVKLQGDSIHVSIRKALEVVDQYFLEILTEQDLLGTESRLFWFISLIENNKKSEFEDLMRKKTTSKERWNVFVNHFTNLFQKGLIPKYQRHLVEEIKLQITYPRLDVNVSTALNHLLKAPFCVHPKTGKVCIPFSVKIVEKFNPDTVPTIIQLVEEINAYDSKTKEIEEKLDDSMLEEGHTTSYNIKDYKKTSLLKPTNIFEEFVRGIERSTNLRINKDSTDF